MILLAMVFGLDFSSSTIAQAATTETAIFAGGCFWCLESDFDKLDGVISTVSGYTGGDLDAPSYKDVSAGGTGHYEAVKVIFDPEKLTYTALVDYFWRHIDPFDDGGQFCDRGDQYRAAVFYADKTQQDQATTSRDKAEAQLGKSVVTQIIPAAPFFDAEDDHQDYYRKNPPKYKFYRWNCGRDQRVKDVWGNTSAHP